MEYAIDVSIEKGDYIIKCYKELKKDGYLGLGTFRFQEKTVFKNENEAVEFIINYKSAPFNYIWELVLEVDDMFNPTKEERHLLDEFERIAAIEGSHIRQILCTNKK